MTIKVLTGKIVKAYALTSYLRELCRAIGDQSYLTSFIRDEHGTGRGFFGVSNTGSYDCLKETLRGITDGLDLRFNTFQRIPYVSASCRNLTARSPKIHRVEHTIEISDQYLELERRYILGNEPFTPNSLGCWFIENQIVCLIEQTEQTGKYSEEMPFRKYSGPIYYGEHDISSLSHSAIRQLNQEVFSNELATLKAFDFKPESLKINAKLIQQGVKHRLPPIELAIQIANKEMDLLYHHYTDKVTKATTPESRYYNQINVDRWQQWKSLYNL